MPEAYRAYLDSLIREIHLMLWAVMASDLESCIDGFIGDELSALFRMDSTHPLSFCIRSYIYGIFDLD